MSKIELITHIEKHSGYFYSKIMKVTQPLNIYFGISYFCYQKVTLHGEWTLLGNNPSWLLHSAANEFYKFDPWLVLPSYYQSGCCFPETHEHQEFQEKLAYHAIVKFNLCHSFAILIKNKNTCEYFFLASPQHTKTLITLTLII